MLLVVNWQNVVNSCDFRFGNLIKVWDKDDDDDEVF